MAMHDLGATCELQGGAMVMHDLGELVGSVKLRGGRSTRLLGGLFIFMGATITVVALVEGPAKNWPVALGATVGAAL